MPVALAARQSDIESAKLPRPRLNASVVATCLQTSYAVNCSATSEIYFLQAHLRSQESFCYHSFASEAFASGIPERFIESSAMTIAVRSSRSKLEVGIGGIFIGGQNGDRKTASERGPTFGPAHPVQKVHIKNHQTLYAKGVGMFASEIGTACEVQSTGFISSNAASMMKERQILVHMLTKKCLKHQMLELHPSGIQEDTTF